MADAAARSLQYEYKANSNLVLQADVRLIDRRAKDEATGEVMSLTGKLGGTRMGDKAQRMKPAKRQKRDHGKTDIGGKSSGKGPLQSDNLEDLSGIIYRPKTQDTKQTYEVLLSFIQEALSDQPRDVLCGAADEVLTVLKNDKLKDKEKKKETEAMLGALPEERFALLVNLGKKITDWGQDDKSATGEEQMDDQYGINVQFEDTDEENEDDNVDGEIGDEDDGEDEAEEVERDHAIHADAVAVDLGGKKEKKLHPLDIDAYWLQRKLSKFYSDPMVSQARAGEVLNILKNIQDERECENQLVVLLGFDCFDFIKLLKQNRHMILYCSLLASAQSEAEKRSIQDEMKSNPHLNKILRQLDTVRDDTGLEPMEVDSKKSSTRHGTSSVKDVSNGSGGQEGYSGIPGLRELLDLEDLAFAQGSHFMANKKCTLPEAKTNLIAVNFPST